MRTVLAALGVLLLCACATPVDWSDPRNTVERIEVKRDDYKKLTTWIGPDCAPGRYDYLALRTVQSDEGAVVYQIYVMDWYGDGKWRFYDHAYDSRGRELPLKVLSRDVGSCAGGGCSHFETVGLRVTRSYLAENSQTGVRFKVSGRRGDAEFEIPGGYIRGFLQAAESKMYSGKRARR